MTDRTLTIEERARRARRDAEAFRTRSLARRSQGPRFFRYLPVVPHVFLAPGRARTAPLLGPAAEVRAELRRDAVFTLDAAARSTYGVGFLPERDLTAYMTPEALRRAVERGLIGPPSETGLSVDPPFPRAPQLIVHVAETPPPSTTLASGERVVTAERLVRDILGTLGFRPDLLARLEMRGLDLRR